MADKHDSHKDDHAHDSHQHEEHHGGLGTYLGVFVALLVLTFFSVTLGLFLPALREKSAGVVWAAMMAISCAKAMLVIMYFMHLKWEANWKYVLTIPASIMSVFLVLMLIPDIGRRTVKYSSERWLYASEPTLPASHGHSDGHTDHDSEKHSDEKHADKDHAGEKHSNSEKAEK